MNNRIIFFVAMLAPAISAHAGNIDLGCQELANNIVMRMKQENLLREPKSASSEERAREISVEVCEGDQESVQQQHDAGIQDALKNFLLQPTGGKAGNKRLKNLKR